MKGESFGAEPRRTFASPQHPPLSGEGRIKGAMRAAVGR